jgi:hypothetical protein
MTGWDLAPQKRQALERLHAIYLTGISLRFRTGLSEPAWMHSIRPGSDNLPIGYAQCMCVACLLTLLDLSQVANSLFTAGVNLEWEQLMLPCEIAFAFHLPPLGM